MQLEMNVALGIFFQIEDVAFDPGCGEGVSARAGER
jgi:hypothetical protein